MIAMYCAFLKANHPVEFTCAWLNSLESHHDKINTAYREAVRMGVEFEPISLQNPSALCRVENGKIVYGLSLIKHCNRQIAEDLLSIKHHESFIDVMVEIKEKTTINSKQLDILVRLDVFSKYGKKEKLLKLISEVNDGKSRYDKKHKDATKEKRIAALKEIEKDIEKDAFTSVFVAPYEQISFELDHYGYIKSTYNKIHKSTLAIMEIDMKPKAKYIVVKAHCYKTGEGVEFRVTKDKFYGAKDIEAFEVGDSIKIKEMSQKDRVRKDDNGEWVKTGHTDLYLERAAKIKSEEFVFLVD